jgi:PhnB protein
MPITDEKYKTWLMHCWLDVGDQALMGARRYPAHK